MNETGLDAKKEAFNSPTEQGQRELGRMKLEEA